MTDGEKLKHYMLPDRNRRFEEVLDRRTSSIRVVVENFHKRQRRWEFSIIISSLNREMEASSKILPRAVNAG